MSIKNILKKSIHNVDNSEIVKEKRQKSFRETERPEEPEGATTFSNLKSNIWWRPVEGDLQDWSNKDFAIHLINLYKNKYNKPCDIHPVHIMTRINDIRESIRKQAGFCDNLVLRDYLSYFCEEWLNYYHVDKKLDYWLRPMRDKKPISYFISQYDYGKYKNKSKHKDISLDSSKFGIDDIRQSYLLGIDSLLLKFGFIISFNYLVKKELFSIEQTAKMIAKSSLKLYNRKSIKYVVMATENIKSYPKSFYDISFIFDKLAKYGCSFSRVLKTNMNKEQEDWDFRR